MRVSGRRLTLVLGALAVVVALGYALRPEPATAEARVERIVSELRCPVCQGLSVGDSPSQTAREMRDLVAQRVAEGRTDKEIRDEFRRAYGDWVFLSPGLDGPAAAMWLLPVVLVGAGALLAWRRVQGGGDAGSAAAAGRADEADARAAAQPEEVVVPAGGLAALRERVAREEAADA